MGQVKRHRPIQKGSVPRLSQSDGTSGAPMTLESIEKYLTFYQEQGCSEETLQSYRRKLEKLYDDLPNDKVIRHGFMNRWRDQLLEEGYSASSVNGFLSASNTFLEFIGHRELQAAEKVRAEAAPQPELTRTEYLDFFLSNQDVSKPKPDPEIYITAIQRLSLSPDEVMVVEDNHNGIAAATAAGANVMKVETVYDVNYENIMNHIAMFEGRNGKVLQKTDFCGEEG